MDIVICMGSSCFCRGNSRIIHRIREYVESRGLDANINVTGHLCESQCKEGPNLLINGKRFSQVDEESVPLLLDRELRAGS